MKGIYKVLLYISLACLMGLVGALLAGFGAAVLGPLTIGMFVALALGVRAMHTLFKSFSFSIWIFASVSLAMFYPSMIAEADLALSISLTAVATMVSPFVTPLLMELLAGQFVPIDALAMMWSILNMIILPIVLGLIFRASSKSHACLGSEGR